MEPVMIQHSKGIDWMLLTTTTNYNNQRRGELGGNTTQTSHSVNQHGGNRGKMGGNLRRRVQGCQVY